MMGSIKTSVYRMFYSRHGYKTTLQSLVLVFRHLEVYVLAACIMIKTTEAAESFKVNSCDQTECGIFSYSQSGATWNGPDIDEGGAVPCINRIWRYWGKPYYGTHIGRRVLQHVKGLQPFTQYRIRATITENGISRPAKTLQFATLPHPTAQPSPPHDVHVTSSTNESVTWAWQLGCEELRSPFIRYSLSWTQGSATLGAWGVHKFTVFLGAALTRSSMTVGVVTQNGAAVSSVAHSCTGPSEPLNMTLGLQSFTTTQLLSVVTWTNPSKFDDSVFHYQFNCYNANQTLLYSAMYASQHTFDVIDAHLNRTTENSCSLQVEMNDGTAACGAPEWLALPPEVTTAATTVAASTVVSTAPILHTSTQWSTSTAASRGATPTQNNDAAPLQSRGMAPTQSRSVTPTQGRSTTPVLANGTSGTVPMPTTGTRSGVETRKTGTANRVSSAFLSSVISGGTTVNFHPVGTTSRHNISSSQRPASSGGAKAEEAAAAEGEKQVDKAKGSVLGPILAVFGGLLLGTVLLGIAVWSKKKKQQGRTDCRST